MDTQSSSQNPPTPTSSEEEGWQGPGYGLAPAQDASSPLEKPATSELEVHALIAAPSGRQYREWRCELKSFDG